MSAFNRFKEYFGMTPVEAYEDEYLDEYDRPVRGEHPADRHATDRHVTERHADYGYRDSYDEPVPARSRYAAVDEVEEPVPAARSLAHVGHAAEYGQAGDVHGGHLEDEPAPRPRRYATPEVGGRSSARPIGATRGAVALAPEEDDFEDGLVTAPETVVERPRGFGDGKGLGENFRAGRAVVLDLSGMAKDDARRMVDFAAGLVFGLDGRMQKVPDRERTFLLQPAGMDLTEAEVREAVSDAFRR